MERATSFSRNISAVSSRTPGIRSGPNGTFFISSGISDLDKIVGGGFPLGSLIMVLEDAESPHHMLLLRNFMSQGLVHNQSLLYGSSAKNPRGFLGTLPNPSNKDMKSQNSNKEESGLRIAWQYKKYTAENQLKFSDGVSSQEFCYEFDLRKQLARHFYNKDDVHCVSIDGSILQVLHNHCLSFLAPLTRKEGDVSSCGRIAIQTLFSPQCEYSHKEWEVLSFILSLKSMLRSANAVAFVTFPPSLVSQSTCKRLEHISDLLFSIKAIADDDKVLAQLLTGYQDMIGFLNIHKVTRLNSQVPMILGSTTFAMKLRKRSFLTLECLNEAPVDFSSRSSKLAHSSCLGPSKSSIIDF